MSQRAGERVLQGLRNCYARLALKVNEGKTAVGPVWGRKFLGYCLMASPQGEVKRAVAAQALDKLRDRIRQLTSGFPDKLHYRVSGTFSVPGAAAIPFDQRGEIGVH